MFKVVKEVIDRFIEWLVSKSKGLTFEDKLKSALQTISFVLVIAIWINLSLIVVDINMKIRLNDTEHAAQMVRKIFDPQNNPLEQFAKINQELSSHVETYHQENILLIKDNIRLSNKNKYLEQENRLLSLEVSAMKDQGKQCVNPKRKK